MSMCLRGAYICAACTRLIHLSHFIHAFATPFQAFAILHSAYRDVKPSNILVDRAWKVKVCDFGLAVASSSSAGTPNYMAPELLSGSSYSSKVDVYAFAVVLNELLARKPPFAGLDCSRVSDLVQNGHRPELAPMPVELSSLIKQCWHQDAQQRPDFASIRRSLNKVASVPPSA